MSFVIITSSKHLSYETPEQLVEDYKTIIKTINSDHVIEFAISDRHECIEFFRETFLNVPVIKHSKRLVYFGKMAHWLVYNLALAAEFPDPDPIF